jgi:hypothetical protein
VSASASVTEIGPEMFDAEMQKLLFPDRVKQLKEQLGAHGAVKAFDLMTSENTPEGKRRVYRITFESGLKLTGSFFLDPPKQDRRRRLPPAVARGAWASSRVSGLLSP